MYRNSSEKVICWFKKNIELKRFEKGQSLNKDIYSKWCFYYKVYKALDSLPRFISPKAKIALSAELSGNVVIEEGAQILPNAFIEGPSYIGKNVLIGNSALIRSKSFISRNSVLGNHSYCTSSILGPKSAAFHFCGVSRSLLERNSRLSAFVLTATTRPDLKPIDKKNFIINSTIHKKGCIVGENSFIGAYVILFPGITIGSNCFIGSFSSINFDIPDGKEVKANINLEIKNNNIKTVEIPPNINILFKGLKI